MHEAACCDDSTTRRLGLKIEAANVLVRAFVIIVCVKLAAQPHVVTIDTEPHGVVHGSYGRKGGRVWILVDAGANVNALGDLVSIDAYNPFMKQLRSVPCAMTPPTTRSSSLSTAPNPNHSCSQFAHSAQLPRSTWLCGLPPLKWCGCLYKRVLMLMRRTRWYV